MRGVGVLWARKPGRMFWQKRSMWKWIMPFVSTWSILPTSRMIAFTFSATNLAIHYSSPIGTPATRSPFVDTHCQLPTSGRGYKRARCNVDLQASERGASAHQHQCARCGVRNGGQLTIGGGTSGRMTSGRQHLKSPPPVQLRWLGLCSCPRSGSGWELGRGGAHLVAATCVTSQAQKVRMATGRAGRAVGAPSYLERGPGNAGGGTRTGSGPWWCRQNGAWHAVVK